MTIIIEIVCSFCGERIDPGSDYHQPHETDCPNTGHDEDDNAEWFHGCTCDLYKCVKCVEAEEDFPYCSAMAEFLAAGGVVPELEYDEASDDVSMF